MVLIGHLLSPREGEWAHGLAQGYLLLTLLCRRSVCLSMATTRITYVDHDGHWI